mmetsp:Transcript_18937/g.38471  ORF Transcript_18937/g.38471 Transcript_18937/m.38471 type:complete len:257 (+) Transcript_18937:44-814(+)
MRVCVYGSSSSATPQSFMAASAELGKLLAERGHICVNGGGKTGCMGAVNDGCKNNGGKIVGVIHEMFLVDKEEHTGVDEMLVATGDGLAERKRLLVNGCDCIISLPGGVGTWDELWEGVAELSLGFNQIPICVVNVDGYYDSFRSMLERAAKEKLIYQKPEVLLHFAHDAADALDWCEKMSSGGAFQQMEISRKLEKRAAASNSAASLGSESSSKKAARSYKFDPNQGARRGFAAGLVTGIAVGVLLQSLWARSTR